MADRRRWAAVVTAAILIGVLAFYMFVVNAPPERTPTGPIPTLQE